MIPLRELPIAFVANIQSIFTKAQSKVIVDALTHSNPVQGLRIKGPRINNPNLIPISYCSTGYIINDTSKDSITSQLPPSQLIYSQDPACMIIEWLVLHIQSQRNITMALDMCASPAGKTLLLTDNLPEALIIANEVDPKRTKALHENVHYWDCANVICTRNQASVFARMDNRFDLILVDAPCSGEGMFRKNLSKSIDHWSEKNIDICVRRQKDILYNIIPSLDIEGYLIYSTCTYNLQENEHIVDWMCKELSMEVVVFDNLPQDEHTYILSVQKGCYRMVPPYSSGEGLFWSVLVKKSEYNKRELSLEEYQAFRKKGRISERKIHRTIPNIHHEKKQELINAWSDAVPNYDFTDMYMYSVDNLNYFLVDKHLDTHFQDIQKNLTISRQLHPLGTMHRKDIKTIKANLK
jgi:16S rRNA C967 or C1407 C5-methylase (RsmB/RsmF family)